MIRAIRSQHVTSATFFLNSTPARRARRRFMLLRPHLQRKDVEGEIVVEGEDAELFLTILGQEVMRWRGAQPRRLGHVARERIVERDAALLR